VVWITAVNGSLTKTVKTAQRPFWRLPATMKKTHAVYEKKYEQTHSCKFRVRLLWIIEDKEGKELTC